MSQNTNNSQEYYQKLHDENSAYQTNNWLILHLPNIINDYEVQNLVEIGCGNGKFLLTAQKHFLSVMGIDFAKSPLFPECVKFVQADLNEHQFDKTDMICSADVLEHFDKINVEGLIRKMSVAAKFQYHVIACYDDGHSHLTVENAEFWQELFDKYGNFWYQETINSKGLPILIVKSK